jgi:hypothetical protein
MKNYRVEILKKTTLPNWLRINSPQIEQFDILIGWDTEYRNQEWELDLEKYNVTKKSEVVKEINEELRKLDKKRTKKSFYNDIISHQFCAYSKEKNVYLEMIIYLYEEDEFKQRLNLSRLLSIVIENLDYGWENLRKEMKALLVAHYSVAEFSTLAYSDRDKLIERLNTIQKTISSHKFFYWSIAKYDSMNESEKAHSKSKSIRILWRDTILLAPQGYKSLKQLAKTTTHNKLDLLPTEYINMCSLLHTNKAKFEEYAINDAIVTLEFYCSFIDTYYFTITDKLVRKIPLTAVGSSELHYLARLEKKSIGLGFKKDYLRKLVFGLKNNYRMINSREDDEGLVNRCYVGGRNNIGKYYWNCDGRKNNKLFIDVDIKDAYSCAFGLLVVPKWNERWRKVITTEKYTKDLAQQYNGELKFSKLGFFETKFNFSKEVYEPILPQKTTWGLVFTKEGKTRATFPEMMEAERLEGIGDEDIRELIVYDEMLVNGKVFYPFKEYIELMTKERHKWPKNSFENLLYKLQKNGLYGKTAQGIEVRQFFSLAGEKETLKPSKITCAEYASHITGIIRTALGALINEIEKFPGCEVVHWTTDGLVMTMKWDYENNQVTERITAKNDNYLRLKDINEKLHKKLSNLRVIRLLRSGAENIGGGQEWLEIKAFGDRIGSLTTRGNWMTWKEEKSGLARGNLGAKIVGTPEDFQRYTNDDEVTEIMIDNLVNVREMIEKKCDLVVRYTKEKGEKGRNIYYQSFRKINLGPDGKRRILEDNVSSRAFNDIEEAVKYRRTIEYMTRKEIRKSTKNVLWQTKISTPKKVRGSRKETIYKLLMTIALKEGLIKGTQKGLVERLNGLNLFSKPITVQNIKDWKRRLLPVKSIPKENFWSGAEKLLRELKIKIPREKVESYLF